MSEPRTENGPFDTTVRVSRDPVPSCPLCGTKRNSRSLATLDELDRRIEAQGARTYAEITTIIDTLRIEREAATPPLDVPSDPSRLRYVLWLYHGHDALYGDDGEMQCNHPPYADFRRDHIDSLLAHVEGPPCPPRPAGRHGGGDASMSEPTCDVCGGTNPPRNPLWRSNTEKVCDPCWWRIEQRLAEREAATPPLDVERWLLRYGRHEEGCPEENNDAPWPSCKCGWADTLARLAQQDGTEE